MIANLIDLRDKDGICVEQSVTKTGLYEGKEGRSEKEKEGEDRRRRVFSISAPLANTRGHSNVVLNTSAYCSSSSDWE